MGLLDEAIREHLELKRRRGADPSAVAREEREALAPVPDAPAFPAEADDRPANGHAARTGDEDAIAPPGDPNAGARAPGQPALGEETAELDMQAAIEELAAAGHTADGVPEADSASAGLEPATHAGDEPASGSFDWEIPGEEELGGV
ncbi:MAG TPA: hypothetical protein VMF09_06210 [Solirubrobacteraceae bacterium]|nr:hypothetical protein [Solirubrobacteraceae bacterium]